MEERIGIRAHHERLILAELVQAVTVGNASAMADRLHELDGVYFGWKRFCQHIIRANCNANAEIRGYWLRAWIISGDHIRNETNDDLVLVRALRLLLPAYQGPAMTLFRGDSAWNRKHRTYGLAWSSDRETAETFVNGIWRRFEGGSVLLQTTAPASAIICAIGEKSDETEYLVDRRALGAVTVLQRFSQLSREDMPA